MEEIHKLEIQDQPVGSTLKCGICKVTKATVEGYLLHLKSAEHWNEFTKVSLQGANIQPHQLKDGSYQCPICKLVLASIARYVQHTSSPEHQAVIKNMHARIEKDAGEKLCALPVAEAPIQTYQGGLKCLVCDVEKKNKTEYLMHLSDQWHLSCKQAKGVKQVIDYGHKEKPASHVMTSTHTPIAGITQDSYDTPEILPDQSYQCKICNMNFPNSNIFLLHSAGFMHRKRKEERLHDNAASAALKPRAVAPPQPSDPANSGHNTQYVNVERILYKSSEQGVQVSHYHSGPQLYGNKPESQVDTVHKTAGRDREKIDGRPMEDESGTTESWKCVSCKKRNRLPMQQQCVTCQNQQPVDTQRNAGSSHIEQSAQSHEPKEDIQSRLLHFAKSGPDHFNDNTDHSASHDEHRGRRPSMKPEARHPSTMPEARHPSMMSEERHPSMISEAWHQSMMSEGQHPSTTFEAQHPSMMPEARHQSAMPQLAHPSQVTPLLRPEEQEEMLKKVPTATLR